MKLPKKISGYIDEYVSNDSIAEREELRAKVEAWVADPEKNVPLGDAERFGLSSGCLALASLRSGDYATAAARLREWELLECGDPAQCLVIRMVRDLPRREASS